MSHTPWTKEDAEKWAMESDVVRKATFEDDAIEGFKAGMAKAAEMIEERDGSRRRKQHGNAVLVSIENE